MNRASCYVISDIRGDFECLLYCFVHLAKVVKMVDDEWEWLAPPETCVIVLGNFINCFENHKRPLSTSQANDRERKIFDFLRSMETLAEKAKCKVVILLGREEVGTLIDDVETLIRGIKDHTDPNERILRQEFLQEYFIPFARDRGVLVRWGDYHLTNMGLELDWLRIVNFQTIPELNHRFRTWIRMGSKDLLRQYFWHPQSPVRSTKMALHSIMWKDHDAPTLSVLLGSWIHPKYVVAGPGLEQLRHRTLSVWRPSHCSNDSPDSLLTLKDDFDNDTVFFVNNDMSDAFGALRQGLRPRHVLHLMASFDKNGSLLFQECLLLRHHQDT